MNKAQQLLAGIKQLFEAAEAPQKYETATLADGTEVTYDKLEVGGVVMVAGAPAPAGDLALADGTVLTLDASGVIVEVKAPEMESVTPAPVAPATIAPVAVAPVAAPAAHEVQLSEQLSKLQSDYVSVTNTISEYSKRLTAQSEMMKQMFDLMTELAGTTAEPAPVQKKKFSFSNIEGKNKSLTKYQEAAAKLKAEYEAKHLQTA